MNWLHEEKEITEISQFPEGAVGFVYFITNLESEKFYIGKKALFMNQSKFLTKKEVLEWKKPGRIPKKRKVRKESDWKSYYGSNKLIKEDVKSLGEEKFQRNILKFCFNKKQMSYWEQYYQFEYNVLFREDSYNDNIAGKFYRKDVAPLEQKVP